MTYISGPWRKSKSAGSAVVSSIPPKNFNDKLKPVAQQALLDYHGGYVVADMVSWENIDLIIAAPDLLAACEAALATADEPCRADHHGYCQTHNLEPVAECWVTKCRAAIAKAHGTPSVEG